MTMTLLKPVKNLLKDSICYLIGPIDYAQDQGKAWRHEFIHKCNIDLEIGIKFLDPTNKIQGLKNEVDEEKRQIEEYRRNERWDELAAFMKQVVRQDHRSIDISDFVVVYINPSIYTCGSYFELQTALSQKKPFFLFVEGGKKKTPAWLFGILNHNFIFDNIDQIVDQLKALDSGKLGFSDRWVLIRKQLSEM